VNIPVIDQMAPRVAVGRGEGILVLLMD